MDLRQAVTPEMCPMAQRLIQPGGGRRPLLKWPLFLLLGTRTELLLNEAGNEALEMSRLDLHLRVCGS